MHHTTGAGYRFGNRQGCLRGTRKDVLWQIECWLTDEQDRRVFWLNGLAGTGKSTIAQTLAETSFSDGKLGASFFCSRDFEDRSDIQNIFPTLAFQLAYRYPQFRRELLPSLRANPEIGRESLCFQLETLIIGPFKTTRIPTLIIIDALDECKDEEPGCAVLSVLSRYIDQVPGVRFFITGRPEPRIRTGFRLELLRPITEVLKLHDVERSSVDGDIKLFLETRLNDIAKTRSDCDFMENWPSSYDIDVLCKKAAGLFIYASTVVKFVTSPYHLPTERLTLIISLPHSTSHEGKSGIDLLYTQVLDQGFREVGLDEQELYYRFRLVVGAALLVFYPLSRRTLSELLKHCGTPSHISNTLRSLHSLLLIPTSEVDPICSFHKSFPDFLTDPGRCKDKRFFVDPSIHHTDVLFSCLDLMKERLRRNICDLDERLTLSEVKDLPTRRESCIGSALEYACRFWAKHLMKIPNNGPHVKRVQESVDEFFTTRLLFWIEVLSLTGNLTFGVYALHDIDQWYLSVSCARHLSKHPFMCAQAGVPCKWTNESQRLILLNFDEICHTPGKIYHSILPFCPSSSWLHGWYTAESLQGVRVVRGRPDRWGTSSRVASFEHTLEALACKKDIIASGLSSGEIVVHDAITGTRKSVLSEHTASVISLAFSADGALVVSGSRDSTIKLWDLQTGGVVKTFHSIHRVFSVSISPDAITIASGSRDSTVCLWDVRTGKGYRIIKTAAEPRAVTCVDFLPTVPGRLMSVSASGFAQQWDVNGSKIGPQLPGHHIAFSPDGRRFVLCDREAPTIRDSDSGTTIAILRSAGRGFCRCCFSPSGEFVAGVANATVYVWNTIGTPSTPCLIGSFIPHDSKISFILYSSSLISAHIDKRIRFWQIGHDSPNSTTTSTGSAVLAAPADITCITLQTEEDSAISVDSAGTVKLWDLPSGLPKTLLQASWTRAHASSVRLVDGVLTIAFCEDLLRNTWKISAWDVETMEKLREIQLSSVPPFYDDGLAMSEDGTVLFSVNPWRIRTWSTLTGESTGSIEHSKSSESCSFYAILYGSTIWTRSGTSSFRGWDLKDLESRPLCSDKMPGGPCLAFIQATRTTWLNTGPTRIEDITSGTEVFRFPERFAQPCTASWNGRYLFAAYQGGEVLILDFVHMIP